MSYTARSRGAHLRLRRLRHGDERHHVQPFRSRLGGGGDQTQGDVGKPHRPSRLGREQRVKTARPTCSRRPSTDPRPNDSPCVARRASESRDDRASGRVFFQDDRGATVSFADDASNAVFFTLKRLAPAARDVNYILLLVPGTSRTWTRKSPSSALPGGGAHDERRRRDARGGANRPSDASEQRRAASPVRTVAGRGRPRRTRAVPGGAASTRPPRGDQHAGSHTFIPGAPPRGRTSSTWTRRPRRRRARAAAAHSARAPGARRNGAGAARDGFFAGKKRNPPRSTPPGCSAPRPAPRVEARARAGRRARRDTARTSSGASVTYAARRFARGPPRDDSDENEEYLRSSSASSSSLVSQSSEIDAGARASSSGGVPSPAAFASFSRRTACVAAIASAFAFAFTFTSSSSSSSSPPVARAAPALVRRRRRRRRARSAATASTGDGGPRRGSLSRSSAEPFESQAGEHDCVQPTKKTADVPTDARSVARHAARARLCVSGVSFAKEGPLSRVLCVCVWGADVEQTGTRGCPRRRPRLRRHGERRVARRRPARGVSDEPRDAGRRVPYGSHPLRGASSGPDGSESML